MVPADEELLVERVGTALVVTLNRPHRANALSDTLMDRLRALWAETARDRSLRSVILTGSGKAFCAGADMALLASDRTDVGADAAQELSFVPGPHLDIPVIVAVNGTCAGGGLHFVADADICIASENAVFIDPHVSVGQVSGLEPLELLMKMRRDAAVRMALLGRTEVLDAASAREYGLVSEVVAPDRLQTAALALAERIGTGSPAAIAATRASIRALESDLLRVHLDAGWRRVQEHWAHPDAKEGPHAFAEKRAPRWAAR